MAEFICNVCGGVNRGAEKLERERPGCVHCGSTVRTRGLLRALSLELFGSALALPDFPRLRSIRALGTSDSSQYADRLAARFDYRNTFFDREPRFDVTRSAPDDAARYDFVISSEVFEHVPPPAATAFGNVCRMLKPTGFLAFTVPYSLELTTAEHFPDLHEFAVTQLGSGLVLVNRTSAGAVQVFDQLVFHRDGAGAALEMREFSEAGLRDLLANAGFPHVRIYVEDDPAFGVVHSENCSLPIVARKAPFAFSVQSAREMAEQYRDLKQKHDAEMRRLCDSLWYRAGRKLKLL